MTVKPKVVFIGDSRVGNFLKEKIPTWDFWPTANTIKEFWEMLDSDQFSTPDVPRNFQIVLILDVLFDEKGEGTDFENLIAQLGQYCFVGILSYKPEIRQVISERIRHQIDSIGSYDTKFYFIDKQRAIPSLDSSIAKFLEEGSDVSKWARNIISGVEDDQEEVETESAKTSAEFFDEDPEENEENDYLGQIIAVTSSKGGSGKSSIALLLASYLGHSSANSVIEGMFFESGPKE